MHELASRTTAKIHLRSDLLMRREPHVRYGNGSGARKAYAAWFAHGSDPPASARFSGAPLNDSRGASGEGTDAPALLFISVAAARHLRRVRHLFSCFVFLFHRRQHRHFHLQASTQARSVRHRRCH